MKKNIVALAVAAAISAPAAMADAPTVYGQANMAIQTNTGSENGTSTNSVASRLGVKGSEDLGNGLKAVYKMEFGVDVDGANGLTARNQYVGLAGGFGTVLMGTHDTPLKMSQPKDLFNDGLTDNGKVVNVLSKGGEVRADNVIAYISPSFSGVKLIAAGVSGDSDANGDSDIADALSMAITYGSKKKGLYLAAAMNTGDAFDNAEETRFSAQYKTGGLVVNGMYETQENVGSATVLSAGYKMGKMMPKIKWADTSDEDNSGVDGSVMAIGLNYSLGKKTTGYVEFTSFDKDFTGGDSYNSTAIGLLHKF